MMGVMSLLISDERTPVKGQARAVVEHVYGYDGDGTEGFSQGSVTSLTNTYPLKILIPSYASTNCCKWIYPINFGGGLVGGDEIQMFFTAKNNCSVLVTGQESTKVYHCEDENKTIQTVDGFVEDGALLCILSDPVVCYRDANFEQKQNVLSCLSLEQASKSNIVWEQVNLYLSIRVVGEFKAGSSNLVYLDWLLAGRVALGELWSLLRYGNQTDVYVNNNLVFRDRYQLESTPIVTIQQSMQQFQVMGSCIILGKKLERISRNLSSVLGKKKSIGEKHDPNVTCSVSPLSYNIDGCDIKGVYIRFLASSSIKAYSSVVSHIVQELKETVGGNPFEDKY